MSELSVGLIESLEASQMRRGEVLEITESGTIVVTVGGTGQPRLQCDLLVTSDSHRPILVPGDSVLTWTPTGGGQPVVLGRIGPSRGLTPEPDDLPDTLLIEAKRSLTLRVGEGSVTIREDGKILIKGKDLVSHAQRMNRIRGGAVTIN